MKRLRIANFVPAGQHCHFAHQVVKPTHSSESHRHDFLELFWITEGSGWERIGDVRRPVAQGSLVFVAMDDDHGFGAEPGTSYRMTNLAFRAEAWRELHERTLQGVPDPFAAGARRHLALSAEELAALGGFAAELEAGARTRAALDRFLLNLLWLVRAHLTAPTASAPPAWLARALAALADDPRRLQAGANALVAATGKSAEHVAREARRHYGRTPTDLVNDARIAWAARRLTESDARIIDLCLDCGLSNLGHFYRLFRARVGETPHRWRARHRGIV
ncbi:MAG TPA: AraC family transcriptional regulator [Planctomycetota bacterium]|nr:AraC family transcriptional regulator [Planctomycetota bacterium]